MADIELEALRHHPLTGVGLAAVVAPESSDTPPELQKFEDAIRSYSLNRQGVDWALVEQLGQGLAAQRCDLKIYGYLVLAAFYCASGEDDESPFLALAAALHALGDVIEKGWERCTPRVAGRRQTWFKWISEEVTVPVKGRTPKPAEHAAFRACMQETERVAELSGKALGLDYPLLRELREALSAMAPPPPAAPPPPPPKPRPAEPVAAVPVSAAVIPAPPSAAVPTQVPVPTAVAATEPAHISALAPVPATAGPPVIADPSELSRDALEDTLATMVTLLAEQLRSESLSDAAPYWLLRALRWAGHDLLRSERTQEVLANHAKTMLPLPTDYKAQSKRIPAWLASAQYAEVIATCEELFTTYPLWLDLQRWVVAALTALDADAARQVVIAQVALLLLRCPELVRFRFGDRDNTPFADAETVSWLETLQQQQPAAHAGAALPSAPSEAPAAALPEGLSAGVQFLQKALTQAGSGRRRFALQLQLAEVLLSNQRSDIAMPVVEALLTAIDAHHLGEWHPELAERALRLAVQTARAAELDAPRRAVLWTRLCQLSPAEALQLGPEQL